jgi:hypothetical protein
VVQQTVSHSEVEQAGHNPGFVNPYYRELPLLLFRSTMSRGIDPVWTYRDRSSERWRGDGSKLGLREDGTIRRSVADRRLHGEASRRSALAPVETNRGCQSAKGYPSSGGFSGSSHFQILSSHPTAAIPHAMPPQGIDRDESLTDLG